MLRRFAFFLAFSFICLAASAVQDIYVTDTLKSLPKDMQLHDLYLRSVCLKKAGHKDSAKALLLEYLEQDTTNGAVYMDLANLTYSSPLSRSTVEYMGKAASLEPDNYWIQRAYAIMEVQFRNFNIAVPIYEKIVKDNPQKIEDQETLASLYSRIGEVDKALKQWRHYESVAGRSEKATCEKAQILINAGRNKEAIAEFDTLIKSDPANCRYKVVKAQALSLIGKTKKSEKLYKKILAERNDCRVDCLRELAIFYLNENQEKKSADCIRQILSDRSLDFESKRAIIVSASEDSSIGKFFGDADFQNLIAQYPENEGAHLLYANLLLNRDDSLAIRYVNNAIRINPKNSSAWIVLIDYYAKNNQMMYKHCVEEALFYNPDNPTFLFQKGSIDLLQHNDSSALEFWRKAADLYSKDQTESYRTSIVYGLIGDMFMQKSEYEQAIDAYDSSLSFNPENLNVLNNYAYTLATLERDLDKAERMSGKTISMNPSNCTFLDTYAWVYFKKKVYSMAQLYIEQALNYGGAKEADVVEHYADILYFRGEVEMALANWRKAASLTDKPNEVLLRKIREGKYISK